MRNELRSRAERSPVLRATAVSEDELAAWRQLRRFVHLHMYPEHRWNASRAMFDYMNAYALYAEDRDLSPDQHP